MRSAEVTLIKPPVSGLATEQRLVLATDARRSVPQLKTDGFKRAFPPKYIPVKAAALGKRAMRLSTSCRVGDNEMPEATLYRGERQLWY